MTTRTSRHSTPTPVSAPAPSLPSSPGRVGRPRGPRRDRAERREELLDAAARAIRRAGPGVSMDELAAEAGITKPILYSHFGDKAGLALTLAERTAEELTAAITAALDQRQPPSEVVRSAIAAFCDFVEREPALYRFLVRWALTDPFAAGSGLASGIAREIAIVLGDALRQAGEATAPAEPWAHAIVGMSFAGVEWWLDRQSMSKEELVDHVSRLMWGGLAGVGLDRLESLPAR